MNGWRTTACVFIGLTFGLLTRELLRDSVRVDPGKTEAVRQNESLKAQVQQLTAELAAARDARRRPRDGAERPAGEIPENSRSPFQDPSKAPTKPADAAAAPAEERVAAARAQLRVARVELQTAMAAHDGEKAMGLLRQFAAISRDLPEARDDAMKLALDINKDVQGAGELRLPMQVFYSGLGDPAIRDLMTWSLETQASSSADFRVLSAWSLPYVLPSDETIARFDAAMSRETDAAVETALVRSLGNMNSAKMEPLLTRLLVEAGRDASVRAEAASALATSKDPAVQRAIDAAAAADPDPRLQAAQRISAVFRDPPSAGCLVLQTNAEGSAAAAGIRPGDLIVSYNGRLVPTDGDLRRETQSAAGVESVAVVVMRDGHEQTMQLKPGRLGITPKSVSRK